MRFTSRAIAVAVTAFATLLMSACGGSLPRVSSTESTPAALALFEATLQAHGKSAYHQIVDVSVSYDGKWRDVVTRFQPVLIDRQFRGTSEERILLANDVTAQSHRGPGGVKHVYRDANSVRVWYNGVLESNDEKLAAAAFVADGYRMFLLGPFYFQEKASVFTLAGEDTVEGKRCDVLAIRARPGFGFSREDEYALYIDKVSHLVRRVRFTAGGLGSLQGVIADVDFFDYRQVSGVWWPTRFFERLRKPIPLLPVHEWRVTGLDVNRGFGQDSILGPEMIGAAAPSARVLLPNK